jgi:hypothetical protein
MSYPSGDPRELFLERLDALPIEGYFVELLDGEGELDDEAEYWGLEANHEVVG